jgi:hypothetical protein
MSAARKLDKMGHHDRATVLKDWAGEMEKKEEMLKWKDRIQDYAPFGTFNLTVKNPETGKKLVGDFHLDINFDDLSFSDESENGIGLFIGLIPSSEELIYQYMELCADHDFGNGFFWGKIFHMNYKLTDKVEFTKWNLWDYDSEMNGEVAFSDRASANKFKNLLIKIFTDPNLGYPSGYNDVEYMYQKLQASILIENSFSSEYGLELEHIADYIKTISPNVLYKAL